MLNTKLDHPNYRAKVVKIEKLEPHPSADRLQIAIVDFQRVITGLDTKVGDLFVYFPLESQINSEFISYINGFSDSNLNADKTKKGFFSKGRVKSLKLRGVFSEGYLHPVLSVNSYLADNNIKFQITSKDIGNEFDSIGDITFCQKYIVKTKGEPRQGNPDKKLKRVSKVIDGQIRLHENTEALKRNIFQISPDDIISCSYKLHGTNFAFARVLCVKKLNIFEKFLKKIGANIVDSEYDWVAASRRVIKGDYENSSGHFYEYDLWSEAMNSVKEKIKDGITIFGEICGMTKTGSYIQKNYDYGCSENDYKIFVFRVTFTDHNGNVIEFTRPQVENYCKKYGLNVAPLFYYGRAKEMYPELSVDNHWHENFLNNLIRDYTEKDCYLCRNKVPEEGAVIVKEGEKWSGFKLKSLNFLKMETESLDSGQVSVDDEN